MNYSKTLVAEIADSLNKSGVWMREAIGPEAQPSPELKAMLDDFDKQFEKFKQQMDAYADKLNKTYGDRDYQSQKPNLLFQNAFDEAWPKVIKILDALKAKFPNEAEIIEQHKDRAYDKLGKFHPMNTLFVPDEEKAKLHPSQEALDSGLVGESFVEPGELEKMQNYTFKDRVDQIEKILSTYKEKVVGMAKAFHTLFNIAPEEQHAKIQERFAKAYSDYRQRLLNLFDELDKLTSTDEEATISRELYSKVGDVITESEQAINALE